MFAFEAKYLRTETKRLCVLTANRCPITTDNPMAKAAEPPRSVRLGSQVANTVKTSSNVTISSTSRACPTDMPPFTLESRRVTSQRPFEPRSRYAWTHALTMVTPSDPLTPAGVTRYMTAAPVVAPRHCAAT